MDTEPTDPVDLGAMMTPEIAAAPQPMFRELRATTPVIALDGMVVLTRRADVNVALQHPELFSSNMDAVDLGNVRPLIPLQIDPPDHIRYRRLLDPLFAPRQVAQLEPDVAALVNERIDAFVDRGECDFAAEFAVPLPSEVFLKLLGLPMADLDTFLTMKDGIIRPGEGDEAKAYQRKVAQDIYDYFDRTLDERQRERRDDLLSRFLDAEVDGQSLSREEILDICFLFLIAGLDTVTDTLECSFARLAQHPDERQAIVDDPSLIPAAVEELLRWESPVGAVARVAVADTEIAGCPVKQGDMVSILIGSANTDEAEFGDPSVDFGREHNKHLAFGGGVHRCLGSHLARLELRVAMREWHRRIPAYSIAPGAELVYTPVMRSVEHLPLVFDR